MLRRLQLLALRLALAAAPLVLGLPAAAQIVTALQVRDGVSVGVDGNGANGAQFPTTVDRAGVRFFLRIENGCDARGRCARRPRTPVDSLQIHLNDRVVFSGAVSTSEQVEVALEDVGGPENQLLMAAFGLPGAAARVSIAAQLEVGLHGGRAVLPFATRAAVLFLHNPESVPLAYRVSFLDADGTRAGESAPVRLAPGAADAVSLGDLVLAGGLAWTEGAAHVDWAGGRRSLLVAGAAKERSGPALILPELGPSPLTQAGFEAVAGEVLDPNADAE